MADTSQADNPPHSNGITDGMDEEDRSKMRPADIDADVREMERRKRVEMIMSSKLFREELERIIETQLKDGSGTTGLMQQISDMMGVSKHAGNVFKNSNCVVPINDIRGIEAMGYAKGEKILRCKLAAVFRLIDLYGWTQGTSTIITARLNQDEEHFLVNPYGMLFHEITASSLIKVAMQGNIIEQGTTNFPVNITAFSLHAAIHAIRPDLKCIIYVHTPSVIAVSALKCGLLPISQEAVVIGDVSVHPYVGGIYDPEEKEKIARNLGPNNKVLLLTNQGAVCCGETIEEAFFNARNTVLACESQLKLMPVGLENLIVLDDETRKKIYDAAHKPPESTPRPDQPSILEGKVERKWRVGGVEFEALMRMLDNAGFRTGYIYRHPLIKGEPPRPKNDVEVPPAVSSLGYLLEEEELYRQGLWKKLEGGRKGNDRTRWLNSPNVYQKVEILETGTPDPKKITKWVADGSPTHSSSTPVKIDSALQFVPKNTNPKEFKQLQQQIKDYRRADKISAGPQSHILEGVTWEEARKMQDASVTQTGDHVVLMGAASKGIIQRGYQHNATMYKSPYAKNPFDSVTDEELDEYKKVVEKKSKGEYDTDYSESEGLSSSQINKRIDLNNYRSPTSETEEESRDEPQVLRIETKQAPRPSQPEVVLSDVERSTAAFINAERATTNNYRSVKVVEIYKKASAVGLLQKHYRTNGFGGLPRGSYAIPNPVHFHIAHYGQTNMSLRPTFVRRQNPTYNTNVHFNENRPHVTISIGNAHECTFNVSMQTLRDFIYPFATALNMENLPRQNTKSAQTSYVQYSESSDNSEIQEITTYTPLPFKRKSQETLGENEKTFIKDDGSDYEMDIMKRLHENLVQDLSRSRETTSSENDDDYTKHNVSHLVHHYEGLADLAQEVANKVLSMTANFSLFEEVIFDALNILKHLPFSSVSDEELIQLIGPSNAKGQESRSSSLSVQTSTRRTDEGFNETQNSSNTTCESKIFDESSVDENVNRLSELIYNYLIRHCYEVKELILFPEVLYDQNIHKLFVEMRRIYQQYFLNMDNEQKNELRIKIGISVIHKLELNEKDVSDANDSVVSDKVFSISEFVSDILDQFFENFVKFDDEKIKTDDTKLMEKNIHHSTPRRLSYLNRKQNEEVTAFKQRESEKSKSESYWIAISPTSSPSVSIQRVNKVINIDDIPLRPPSDLFESSFRSTQLSPIPEEPRYNLFNVSTDDHKLLQKSDCSVRTLHDDYEIFGYMTDECKISDGENGENKENRDDSISYYSFKQPEVNVVVCNSATFHRTKTINCESYVQSSNIIFERQPLADLPKTPLNKSEDDSDDGDWMGYEMARF